MTDLPLAAVKSWTVGWGFSTRCDLNCPFCYSARVRYSLAQPEVDLVQAERFLSVNGHTIRAINFGTGECFLAPSFMHLLALCQQYAPQAAIAVTSNGALADVPVATISDVGHYLTECDISLDFADPVAHDHWRGNEGAWQRANRAIETALALGLNTSIVMIGTPQTLTPDNLSAMLAVVKRYHVALRVNIYMPTTGDTSFIPTTTTIFDLLATLKAWTPFVRSSDRLLGHILGNDAVATGWKNRYSCRILPDGKVSPSTYLLRPPWTLETMLDDIVLLDLPATETFQRYAVPPVPSDCADCPYVAHCQGGSVERRWLWSHSLTLSDPLCPLRYPDANDWSSLSDPSQSTHWVGPTIHLDYLPTIVALPPTYEVS